MSIGYLTLIVFGILIFFLMLGLPLFFPLAAQRSLRPISSGAPMPCT